MFWPLLSVVFWQLVHLGSFLASWRQANVTPVLKDPASSSVANYRLIFISEISEQCEILMLVFSDHLWNAVVCFQPPVCLS